MKNSFHFSLSWLPDSDDNGNLVLEQIDVCYWPYQEQAGEPAGLRGHHSITWTRCERFIREDLGLTLEEQEVAFGLLNRGGFEFPDQILPVPAHRGVDAGLLSQLGIDLVQRVIDEVGRNS